MRGKSFVLNTWNGEHCLNINICYNKRKTFRHIFSTFVCVSGGGLFAQGVNVRGVNVQVVIVRGVNVRPPYKTVLIQQLEKKQNKFLKKSFIFLKGKIDLSFLSLFCSWSKD